MENDQNVMDSILGNMALAHEMIMNDDFKLKSINESTNNSMEKNIHDIMHKAFWDVLEEEITSDPPQYKNSFNLLMEMKELILDILPKKGGENIRKDVEEVLDADFIQQQIEHEAFDIISCAGFILNLLSKICAPVRDETINKLKVQEDLIPLLRGTFEVISLMKMDLVNYEITAIKPILMQQAVKYENEKFEEYLKENEEGLKLTKTWLKNALHLINKLQNPSSPTKVTPGIVITNAYLSLLSPDENFYPETLILDKARLQQVACQFEVLINTVSVLTYCLHFLPPHLSTDESFVIHLKNTILILIQDTKMDEAQIESIFLQLYSETEKECQKRELNMKPSSQWDILKNQLRDLLTEQNHLKTLVKSRVRDYVLLSMTSQNLHIPIFTVLSPIKDELKDATSKFVRVILHNKKVHHARYIDIVDELLKENEKCVEETESQKENKESVK